MAACWRVQGSPCEFRSLSQSEVPPPQADATSVTHPTIRRLFRISFVPSLATYLVFRRALRGALAPWVLFAHTSTVTDVVPTGHRRRPRSPGVSFTADHTRVLLLYQRHE